MSFFLNKTILFIAYIVNTFTYIYSLVLIASALISWVDPNPYNPIVRFLRSVTEPVLYRVRKFLPFTYTSGIDFSVIVVLLFLAFIEKVVVPTILKTLL